MLFALSYIYRKFSIQRRTAISTKVDNENFDTYPPHDGHCRTFEVNNVGCLGMLGAGAIFNELACNDGAQGLMLTLREAHRFGYIEPRGRVAHAAKS